MCSKILFVLRFASIVILFSINPHSAFAWLGKDYENNSTIDIGPGNYVRAGSIIKYYDERTRENIVAKVIDINTIGTGDTKLEVEEQEGEKKIRTFYMESSSGS